MKNESKSFQTHDQSTCHWFVFIVNRFRNYFLNNIIKRNHKIKLFIDIFDDKWKCEWCWMNKLINMQLFTLMIDCFQKKNFVFFRFFFFNHDYDTYFDKWFLRRSTIILHDIVTKLYKYTFSYIFYIFIFDRLNIYRNIIITIIRIVLFNFQRINLKLLKLMFNKNHNWNIHQKILTNITITTRFLMNQTFFQTISINSSNSNFFHQSWKLFYF